MRTPRCSRRLSAALVPLLAAVPACDAGDRDRGARRAADTATTAAVDTVAAPSADSAATDSITLPAAIRLLRPADFPSIPRSVRTALEEADCAVPQAAYPTEPNNVVSGELAAPGQTDWAALCAHGDSTGIMVVWGGPARCRASLAWEPNDIYLQDLGGGRPGFSRAIGIASMVAILRRAQAYEGPEPPARDHAGLEDIFIEKASTVRFCHDGAWLQLQGAD